MLVQSFTMKFPEIQEAKNDRIPDITSLEELSTFTAPRPKISADCHPTFLRGLAGPGPQSLKVTAIMNLAGSHFWAHLHPSITTNQSTTATTDLVLFLGHTHI